jgi:hypothetical protein
MTKMKKKNYKLNTQKRMFSWFSGDWHWREDYNSIPAITIERGLENW